MYLKNVSSNLTSFSYSLNIHYYKNNPSKVEMHSIFLHSFHLKKITQHVLLTFSSSCNLHSSDVTQGYEEQRMNVRLAFEEIFGTAVTDSNTSSMTITALQNFFCPQVSFCTGSPQKPRFWRILRKFSYQWKQKALIQKDEDMGSKPKKMEVLWKASRKKKN